MFYADTRVYLKYIFKQVRNSYSYITEGFINKTSNIDSDDCHYIGHHRSRDIP